MTINYLDSKRIGALSTDYGAESQTISDDLTTNNGWVFPTNSSYDSTNDQIDLTIASSSFDVSYIDLQKAVYFGSGNNLNDDNFVIRARITKNNDLGNTSKGSSLLLQVSSALTDSSKSPNPQDAVGMRIDTDRTSSNAFYVHSTDNGTFWDGESSGISYSWGTGDLYWEIIGDGTNVTGELFTGSDYSTGSLGKVTTSQQSPTGMRYLKFCGFNDPSRTATQFSLQDFKIWNGVSSIPAKPTSVQDNYILVEKDTGKRFWFSEATAVTYTGDMSTGWTKTGSDFTIDTTDNEVDYLGTYNSQNVYFDLETVETLSTSGFVIRFTIKQTGTASGDSPVFWFGCSETGVTSANSTATDFIGFSNHVSAGTAVLRPYQSMSNDARLDQSTVQSRLQLSGSNVDLANDNTLYYYEIVRDGSNFTSNVYSDSGYSTLLATRTNAVPAGGEVLRYFIIANYQQGSGVTGTFGNFKLYNGVTSVVSPTWTPMFGTRGLFMANAIIDYITVATTGNATDFGDPSVTRYVSAGCNSDTRGVFSGGGGAFFNVIDYVTIATPSNATDFGNLTASIGYLAGLNSDTRGVIGGGYNGAYVNFIDYITIASVGNATNFGDMSVERGEQSGSCHSDTRGIFAGGYGSGAYQNVIDYITIATTGNATDFGNLTVARKALSGCNSATRGIIWGGDSSTVIEYMTIATPSNATDFGDLLENCVTACGACDNGKTGVYANNTANQIQYITIDTTGNATDFGDLTVGRTQIAGCNDGL